MTRKMNSTRKQTGCLLGALALTCGTAAAESARWIYLPGENGRGVISNDNAVAESSADWVLNVLTLDESRRTLSLGTGEKTSDGKAYVAGAAYCYAEDGTVRGGSRIDLSQPITDLQGNRWTVERILDKCLYDSKAPTRTFIAPRELRVLGGDNFNYARTEALDLVLDCPYLASLPGGVGLDSAAACTVDFRLPTCSSVKNYAFRNFTVKGTGQHDLSGLESIGSYGFWWPWNASQPTTNKLPRLRTVVSLGFNNGLSPHQVVEWGNGFNSLMSVGAKAWNPQSSYIVDKLVLGCAAGCTFGRYAINLNGLRRVYMTGAVPSFANVADGDCVFGSRESGSSYSHASEKTIVFYVPNTKEWAGIRAMATPLTEVEKEEFVQAHPDWEMPFGTVDAAVFKTKNRQYIGDVDFTQMNVWVTVNSYAHRRYGDTWSVADTWTISYVQDGETVAREVPYGAMVEVPYGAAVTLSVSTAGASAPEAAWEGKLPDGSVPANGKQVTFNATASTSLYVSFASAWTYDADAGTVADGYWTLMASENGDGSLKITGVADISKRLEGELNLTGPVYVAGDSAQQKAITRFGWQAFLDTQITSFYAPRTLVGQDGQFFPGGGNCANLVMDCPAFSSSFEPFCWTINSLPLSRAVFKLPRVGKIAGAYYGNYTYNQNSATFYETALVDWDLSGVADVGVGGLVAGQESQWYADEYGKKGATGPRGELVLPNVETIGKGAFSNWKRVTAAALGTNGTLKTLGDCIFENNGGSLKKVDFGMSSAFVISNRAFYATAAATSPLPLEELWFSDKAPVSVVEGESLTTLEKLVAGRTLTPDAALGSEDVSTDLKIVAPFAEKTWQSLLTRPVPAEYRKAKKRLEAVLNWANPTQRKYRVLGVYRSATDGRFAAWMVQNPDFEYREGLAIIIR